MSFDELLVDKFALPTYPTLLPTLFTQAANVSQSVTKGAIDSWDAARMPSIAIDALYCTKCAGHTRSRRGRCLRPDNRVGSDSLSTSGMYCDACS